MFSFIIEGGKKLKGEVINSGSKNASLPILATAILNPNPVTFYNVPDIEDIKTTLEILKLLGCKITRKYDKITISSRDMNKNEIPQELMHKARSTVILAGAIIGRFRQATFSYPGGCNIGARPIDLHIKAFKDLGINIEEKENKIICTAKEIRSSKIKLGFPSVGATENIILASVYAKGVTHIFNAAKEPEINDLANCLNKMGAKIFGAGTSKITIIGVNRLHSVNYKVMPDRIEAATFLAAATITNGSIKIKDANPRNLLDALYKLKEMGCKITISSDSIFINAPRKIEPTSIKTEPYPGFPTDMQPIFTSVLTKASGNSTIEESIFENRFEFCKELNRMGANIKFNENKINITGVRKLKGNSVKSKDLRGGVALVLAGLYANGTTVVENAEYILRGYEKLDEKLTLLGAKIRLQK